MARDRRRGRLIQEDGPLLLQSVRRLRHKGLGGGGVRDSLCRRSFPSFRRCREAARGYRFRFRRAGSSAHRVAMKQPIFHLCRDKGRKPAAVWRPASFAFKKGTNRPPRRRHKCAAGEKWRGYPTLGKVLEAGESAPKTCFPYSWVKRKRLYEHRVTRFLMLARPEGFRTTGVDTLGLSDEKARTNLWVCTCLFIGPPGGIRTPGLWNRNPLRYPASPRADIMERLGFYTVFLEFATPNFTFSRFFYPETPASSKKPAIRRALC